MGDWVDMKREREKDGWYLNNVSYCGTRHMTWHDGGPSIGSYLDAECYQTGGEIMGYDSHTVSVIRTTPVFFAGPVRVLGYVP